MNKKQSIIIWLSVFVLLCLGTLSVFAQTPGNTQARNNSGPWTPTPSWNRPANNNGAWAPANNWNRPANNSGAWKTPTPVTGGPWTPTPTPDRFARESRIIEVPVEVDGPGGQSRTVVFTQTEEIPPELIVITETVSVSRTTTFTNEWGFQEQKLITVNEVITSVVRYTPPPPPTHIITQTMIISHADGNVSIIVFTRTVPFISEGQPSRLIRETIRITDANGLGFDVEVWTTLPIPPTPTPVPIIPPTPTATPWPTSNWKPTATPSWRPTATPTPVPIPPWRGQYWSNPEFSGAAARTRNDETVDFSWGRETAMWGYLPPDHFSARWTKTERGEDPGFYRVRAVSDYGMRFSVNGQNVIDEIRNFNTAPVTGYFWSEGNETLSYRYDYFHSTGFSVVGVDVEAMGTSIAPFGRGTVVNGAPTLRDGPGNYYNGNGRLATGEVVTLTGHRNIPTTWVCVVREDGSTGWINEFYLASNTNFESLRVWPFYIANGEPTAKIKANFDTVRLRYGPAQSANIIAQANAGTEVVLVGRSSTNNWILVRMWDGSLGWVPTVTLQTNYNLRKLPLRHSLAPVDPG